MDRAALLIGTWFGCGYFPFGPGTAGSIAAVLIAATGVPPGWAAALLVLPGVWASRRAERILGRGDPSVVVVDEVVGQWITLAAIPWSWPGALLALGLFRFFDIVKPWPVRRFESLPGGWGVMMDDVAAGVLGAIALLAAQRFNLIP
jgi:phosphatidylglycerophosphatase A